MYLTILSVDGAANNILKNVVMLRRSVHWLKINTVKERQQKQWEYQQWYQEQNHEALLKLQYAANMNETQNRYGLLDMWLTWMKLRQNAT